MHQFSDSDSYDSDQGIRFKTDSTRCKYEGENLSSSKAKRSRSRSPRIRRRHDKSSSSRSSDPTVETHIEGPALPPHLLSKPAIGPQLPPHLLKKTEGAALGPQLPPSTETWIGPQLPPDLQASVGPKLPPTGEQNGSDDEIYGPLPVDSVQYSKAQIALEERALMLKINQLEPDQTKSQTREEWMLELPEVKAEKFGLGPRQFRSKAGPDMSDRSSWTDTPDTKKPKTEKLDLKKVAVEKEIRRRDVEQERLSKKHKKKNKESLLEIHQSKMKKQKKEEGPSERRPFSRDTDLQVNRFDEAQKKAVLKKAQLLDDRFSSGQSKFL